MRIVVVGGTGFIGESLCEELDGRGHEVTALSRSPGDADLPAGVEEAIGVVTACDSIEADFEGQDAAVNLVALSPLFRPSGATRPTSPSTATAPTTSSGPPKSTASAGSSR